MKNPFKQLLPKSKSEWLNISAAILGVVMILLSVFCGCSEDNIILKKLFTVLGNLGIGIFPTGIIGLLLERMKARDKSEQKHRIRSAILQSINVSIHSYFNVICNSAILRCQELKGLLVFDIFQALKDKRISLDYDIAEKEALKHLITIMKSSFETPDPTYIIADIFSQGEENHFSLLIKKGEDVISCFDSGGNDSSKRFDFLSYLQVACEEIPEWNRFKNMISDGDNIFIPNTD